MPINEKNQRFFECALRKKVKERGKSFMTLQMLKGKIHRATVIQVALDYVGSITIDEDLLDAAWSDHLPL